MMDPGTKLRFAQDDVAVPLKLSRSDCRAGDLFRYRKGLATDAKAFAAGSFLLAVTAAGGDRCGGTFIAPQAAGIGPEFAS
jgi:hypothetical protein